MAQTQKSANEILKLQSELELAEENKNKACANKIQDRIKKLSGFAYSK